MANQCTILTPTVNLLIPTEEGTHPKLLMDSPWVMAATPLSLATLPKATLLKATPPKATLPKAMDILSKVGTPSPPPESPSPPPGSPSRVPPSQRLPIPLVNLFSPNQSLSKSARTTRTK